MQEFLDDEQTGKKIEWREKKIPADEISGSLKRIGSKSKGERMAACSDYLVFKKYEDETMRLHSANFCKVRLCPMCEWRKTLKMYGQVSKIMDYVEATEKYQFLFLTLTAKNVPGENLSAELDKLFHAFKKLNLLKIFTDNVRGWYRALEVTHRWVRGDYHPHFHILLAVDETYAKYGHAYIEQHEWIKIWRQCLSANYDPNVDIRAVKPAQGDETNYSKAVAEITKYTVKSADLIYKPSEKLIAQEGKTYAETIAKKKTDAVMRVMDSALHGRRLTAFGGRLKEIKSKLDLEDAEKGDLVNVDNEPEIRNDLAYVLVRYVWDKQYQDYIKHNEND